MTSLTLTGLTKAYPGAGQAAVQGLNLTVETGSLTALLGPSGACKTTAMKLIAGLLTPDAGQIALAGESDAPAPDMPVMQAANNAIPIERACRAGRCIHASFHIAVSLIGGWLTARKFAHSDRAGNAHLRWRG